MEKVPAAEAVLDPPKLPLRKALDPPPLPTT
jgi:hypothetical protein